MKHLIHSQRRVIRNFPVPRQKSSRNDFNMLQWHRQGFKLYWNAISRRGKRRGRPRVSIEIRGLIHRIALENLSWRAPRIHGELLKLGFDVSERTISRYLHKREPDEDKVAKWKTLLKKPYGRYSSNGLLHGSHRAFQATLRFFHHRPQASADHSFCDDCQSDCRMDGPKVVQRLPV